MFQLVKKPKILAEVNSIKQPAQKQNIILVGIIFGLVILLSLLVENFATPYNIFNIITQASIYGTMAVGLTFVLITGGIDISLPAVMTAGAVVGVTYMAKTGDGIVGSLIIFAVCMLAGLINAIAVTAFNMQPLIVTLAMFSIAQGFATWYTNYMTIMGIPKWMLDLFRSYILGVPFYVIIFLLVVVVCQFVLKKTVYGRWLYFVGTNKNTAYVSGVPVRLTTGIAYVLSALSAGLAGIMLSTRMGSAQPGMGQQSMVLDIISSAVIGGVSIFGGKGTVVGAACGAIFIALISNVMNLLSIQFYSTLMIKGLIIILATAFDYYRNR